MDRICSGGIERRDPAERHRRHDTDNHLNGDRFTFDFDRKLSISESGSMEVDWDLCASNHFG